MKKSMLFKKYDPPCPENHRGIALLNCFTKIVSQLQLNWLSEWFEYYRTENGKGKGCLESVFTLSSLIYMHRRLDKRKVYAVLKQINHYLLFPKLYTFGLNLKIITIISDFLLTCMYHWDPELWARKLHTSHNRSNARGWAFHHPYFLRQGQETGAQHRQGCQYDDDYEGVRRKLTKFTASITI